jgi:enoyl-CoA hydratase/carnithine racemase
MKIGEKQMGKRIENNVIVFEWDHGPMNTIALDTLRSLDETLLELEQNDDLLGMILTGRGKLFSSGFDLPMFLGFQGIDDVIAFFRTEEAILARLFACSKPVISAINGHCVAAGLIYSLGADYRIVSNHSKIKIGMSEIKIGLPLSIAQSEVVRFGLDSDTLFRDVMYFGPMFDPQSAKERGIVDEVVDLDALLPRAKEIISLWMNNPGRAFMQIKKTARQPVLDRMRSRLEAVNWNDSLQCFLKKDVRQALMFVQSKMESR